MATTLHRVFQNFVWRMEAITPTCTRGTLRTTFVHLNGTAPGQSSGTARGFEVQRLGRERAAEPTTLYSRYAWHDYQVEVYYPLELKPDAREEVLAQDAHDLIVALRDPAGWPGYDATHTSTDIGIKDRREDGDVVVTTKSNIILRQRWKVFAREVEYA